MSKNVFYSLDVRVGTVVKAELNLKARKPGFRLEVDFGPGFAELKQSSAQLVDLYSPPESLVGTCICAVTNFPIRAIGIRSYFLTLGVMSVDAETVIVKPSEQVARGSRIGILGSLDSLSVNRLQQVTFDETLGILEIRCGTLLQGGELDFGKFGKRCLKRAYHGIREGMQVLRIMNLDEDDDNILGVRALDGYEHPICLERRTIDGSRLG